MPLLLSIERSTGRQNTGGAAGRQGRESELESYHHVKVVQQLLLRGDMLRCLKLYGKLCTYYKVVARADTLAW